MVHAINQHGQERLFSDRVWNLMPKHKNGWREYSESGELVIPQQIVEFQQLRKEGVVVEEKKGNPESAKIANRIMDELVPPKPKKVKPKKTFRR